MWVKVCGTTSLTDAQLAFDSGADALGFLFAPSPRQVTPAQVRAIAAKLPPQIERYGVFVHPTFTEVVETVAAARLTGVQLHATDDPTLARRLREHFQPGMQGKRLGILRVLHFPESSEGFARQLEELTGDHLTHHAMDALLIDSRVAARAGGTGLRFDWAGASGSFLRAAPHLRLIVAGGLSPENVAEAIATLRPWGVDVVSGVESEPGRKDPSRVRAFVERARATARALEVSSPMRA